MALGSRAQSLLHDETLREVFDHLESKYIKEWRQTRPGQNAEREILYLAINALGKVREELRIIFDNGKLAAVELDHMNKQRSVANRVKA